jgi:xylulokinase
VTRHILVLDVGTSALKAVLFDAAGNAVAGGDAGYGEPLGPHRQDAHAWWAAARRAITEIRPHRVDAIVLTGTMENLIALDDAGRAVHDVILYSDPCGADALQSLAPALAAIDAGEILGNPPEPLMTAFKLRWLMEHEPEAAWRARWFLPGAKDALALHLTGRAATDPVTGATTGLMDLRRRCWSEALLAAIGIPAAKLPEILSAGATLGMVTGAAAADLGLDVATPIPVINGCGDGGATTVGSWCRDEGDVSLYLGTSGWLARVVPDRDLAPNPAVYRLAHPAEGLIVEITPILSAGAAGNWVREVLAIPAAERDGLLAEADRSPPDLVFLPYLAGERFPFFDTHVRAAFVGLDATHQRRDLYYAVLEGVGFAIRANLAAIDPVGNAQLRLAGGGATSAVWPQMLADLLGRPVSIPGSPEDATAMGAFLIAAEALGLGEGSRPEAALVLPRPERGGRAARMNAAYAHATDVARRLKASR